LTKLKRDAAFWTITGQTTILNFFLGGFGPAQPLLREEQGTSLTIAGLHGTMMGISSIIAGYMQPHLVHKLGRRNSSWLGLLIFTSGIPAFALLKSVQATLISTFFLSIGFSMVINNMIVQLSHHYPKTPDLAVAQTGAVNSVGYVLGTVTVGTLATMGTSWRVGLLLCLPASLLVYIFGKNKIVDARDHEAPKQVGKLSRIFWIAWIGFFATIASEFATTFWAAGLLKDRATTTSAISTLCVAAVGSGMATGRWYTPIWLKRFPLDTKIKIILITQLLSFGVFWLSHSIPLSLIALFITGIGISTQFPMSATRLINFSGNRPDLAIGKASLAAGLAIALSPFCLATMGDHIGISKAYLMVPLLIATSYLALIFASSQESR
jgi:predicted MFS family arabinose efflux permease